MLYTRRVSFSIVTMKTKTHSKSHDGPRKCHKGSLKMKHGDSQALIQRMMVPWMNAFMQGQKTSHGITASPMSRSDSRSVVRVEDSTRNFKGHKTGNMIQTIKRTYFYDDGTKRVKKMKRTPKKSSSTALIPYQGNTISPDGWQNDWNSENEEDESSEDSSSDDDDDECSDCY